MNSNNSLNKRTDLLPHFWLKLKVVCNFSQKLEVNLDQKMKFSSSSTFSSHQKLFTNFDYSTQLQRLNLKCNKIFFEDQIFLHGLVFFYKIAVKSKDEKCDYPVFGLFPDLVSTKFSKKDFF